MHQARLWEGKCGDVSFDNFLHKTGGNLILKWKELFRHFKVSLIVYFFDNFTVFFNLTVLRKKFLLKRGGVKATFWNTYWILRWNCHEM